MKSVLFLVRGIFYTVLTSVWFVFLVCLFVMVMFVVNSIIPVWNSTPIEGPMYRDHGLGPN